MRALGGFLLFIGVIGVSLAIWNLNYIGAWLQLALDNCALFMQGSLFGIKNATLFLYGGAAAAVIGIALIALFRPQFHRH
jgi:hypothetical protein